MKKNVDVKKLTYTALLIAVGILLPQIFHLIGGSTAGQIFLPMHIPVMLAGFLLGPVSGLVTGLVTPVVSSLLTGMPSAAPLPFMTIELIGYGVFSGIFYRLFQKYKAGLLLALVLTMITGRLLNALALVVAGSVFGLTVAPAVSVVVSLGTGLPGIVIQLIFIPMLMFALRKAGYHYE